MTQVPGVVRKCSSPECDDSPPNGNTDCTGNCLVATAMGIHSTVSGDRPGRQTFYNHSTRARARCAAAADPVVVAAGRTVPAESAIITTWIAGWWSAKSWRVYSAFSPLDFVLSIHNFTTRRAQLIGRESTEDRECRTVNLI